MLFWFPSTLETYKIRHFYWVRNSLWKQWVFRLLSCDYSSWRTEPPCWLTCRLVWTHRSQSLILKSTFFLFLSSKEVFQPLHVPTAIIKNVILLHLICFFFFKKTWEPIRYLSLWESSSWMSSVLAAYQLFSLPLFYLLPLSPLCRWALARSVFVNWHYGRLDAARSQSRRRWNGPEFRTWYDKWRVYYLAVQLYLMLRLVRDGKWILAYTQLKWR